MKTTRNITSKDKQFIAPQIADAVQGDNCYGLDVSNVDYIKFTSENIVIEVVGGVYDVMLSSLRVSLKIYKIGASSPLEIYRSSQVDLFNENQIGYLVGKVCERLKIETTRFKNLFYDFIERIDNYRRNRTKTLIPVVQIPSVIKQEALRILKSDDLLASISELLKQAGISDTRLGLQLFITGISRITEKPIHTIVLAPRLLVNILISEFIEVLPKEQVHELTTVSKHALSYPPTANYWDYKTLVLHQLESIHEKNNTLLEYLLQGQSKRLVTQTDTKTGNYQSRTQVIASTINLISYTSKDYHPVFSGRQTLCVPLRKTQEIEDKLYIKQVKQLSGLWDADATVKASQLLAQLQRELEAVSIYNPIIEQIDLSAFFGKNLKDISMYLQLVNLITILHQHQHDIRLTHTQKIIEVVPEYMIQALMLYREVWLKKDDELYFNVRGTFNRLKAHLKKTNKSAYQTSTFKLKEVRKALGKAPVTMQRHLNTLEEYGKVERCSGNNRTGYEYRILEWEETGTKTEAFERLLENLNAL